MWIWGGRILAARKLNLLTPEGDYNYLAYLLADENNVSVRIGKYRGSSKEDLIENMLLPKLDDKKKSILLSNAATNKQLVLKIVSMPEYQLC